MVDEEFDEFVTAYACGDLDAVLSREAAQVPNG